MKKFVFYFLLIGCVNAFAQSGFVKLENDSVIKGFVRSIRDVNTNTYEFEIWKTKKDKNPIRISRNDVVEYCLGKDTIKILRNFEDEKISYTEVDARYILTGKINLLKIDRKGSYIANPATGVAGLGISIVANELRRDILVLESKSSLRAMPFSDKDLHDALLEFFPENFLSRYEQKFGSITYRSLPKLIEFYNSKN